MSGNRRVEHRPILVVHVEELIHRQRAVLIGVEPGEGRVDVCIVDEPERGQPLDVLVFADAAVTVTVNRAVENLDPVVEGPGNTLLSSLYETRSESLRC